jgi:hypothetical protein
MAMAENREREETQRAAPTGNGDAAIIPLGGQTQLGGRSWNLGNQGMPGGTKARMDESTDARALKESESISFWRC